MNIVDNYDQIYILDHHIPMIEKKLEELRLITEPDSNFMKAYKTDKTYESYAQKYVLVRYIGNGPLPTKPSKQYLTSLSNHIITPFNNIYYIYNWYIIAQHQLMNKGIGTLDIRYNQLITLSILRIYVTFCKLTLFFKEFYPILCSIVIFPNCASGTPALDKLPKEHIPPLVTLLYQFHENWSLFSKSIANQSFISSLGKFVNTVSPFLSKYISPQISVDWQSLSIYLTPAARPDSTLPSDDIFIYTHFKLILEVFIFYAIIYPEQIEQSSTLRTRIDSAIAECPLITITPNYTIPIAPFIKHLIPDFPKPFGLRMTYLSLLLRELVDLVSYDPSQLSQFLRPCFALTGLANYEINNFLLNRKVTSESKPSGQPSTPSSFEVKSDLKLQQMKAISEVNNCSKEFMELLQVVIELRKHFQVTQDEIKRFYVFNLATIDYNFLCRLIANMSPESSEVYEPIKRIADSLFSLDLEAFDAGDRYEFTPLILSFGRILYHANTVEMKFVSPVFEHLMTIHDHCLFAANPIQYFDSILYIPLIGLKYSLFGALAKDSATPLSTIPALLEMFDFAPQTVKTTADLSLIKNAICDRINKDIESLVGESSKIYKIGGQPHDLLSILFKIHDYQIPSKGFTKSDAQAQAITKLKFLEIIRFYDTISLGDFVEAGAATHTNPNKPGNLISTVDFFSKSLMNALPQYMKATSPQKLDQKIGAVYRILWPLYQRLNIPFESCLYTYLLNQTAVGPKTFLDQANLLEKFEKFNSKGSQILSKDAFILGCIDKMNGFLDKDYKNALYIPPLHGFFESMIGHSTPEFFTTRTIRLMITNMGPMSIFPYMKILNHKIAEGVIIVYETFMVNHLQITDWYTTFGAKINDEAAMVTLLDEIQNNKTMEIVCKKITTLGVCLALRKMIQEASSETLAKVLPGLAEIFKNKMKNAEQKKNIGQKERLLKEIFGLGKDDICFIKKQVAAKIPKKEPNMMMFFFFLAILLTSSSFEECIFYPEHEAVQNNLHLFPLAYSCFVYLAPELFISSTEMLLNDSLEEMVKVIKLLVNWKEGRKMAYLFVASLLPKYIPLFEFGKLDEIIPNFSPRFIGLQQ